MKRQTMTMTKAAVLIALAVGVPAASAFARESSATSTTEKSGSNAWRGLVGEAESTATAFREADPSLSRFFSDSVGYAIFPRVGKGAVGIGGAYGRGVLFERGEPTGRSTLTQVTIGPQLGGEAYSEVVFFETPAALARFKKSEYAMAAQVGAVVAASGASANARYAQGVAVFTLPRSGLMAEASVGGQRFAFTPVGAMAAGTAR